ncbi:MAG: hypothetical protein EBQ89_09330 [Alphaproteobacteria bacterium]|nr:hypothetical protein [Alphaproteobacteria bacterium]
MSILAVAWDIDGCIYPYAHHQAPEGFCFYRLCDEAGAEAALNLMPSLGRPEALRLMKESFDRYRDSFTAFLPVAEERGLCPHTARDKIFTDYHALLRELIKQRAPDFFEGARATRTAFPLFPRHVRHGTLTNACLEGWGMHVLQEIGIRHYFDPDLFFDMRRNDFHPKAANAIPIENFIKAAGLQPHQVALVEDSVMNTVHALEIGVQVAILHHGQPPKNIPAGVRWVCRDAEELRGQMAADLGWHVEPQALLPRVERGSISGALPTPILKA